MIPRLENKYDIDIEVTAKPQKDYMTDEYFELDLPVAPAIMVGNEVIVEGSDVEEDKLEAAICRHLGLPQPVPSKKRILNRLLKR